MPAGPTADWTDCRPTPLASPFAPHPTATVRVTPDSQQSASLSDLLGAMALRRPEVVAVRGAGMIWGVELAEPAGEVVARAMDLGLLLCSAGPDVVRIVPPLVATDEELARGIATLEEAL